MSSASKELLPTPGGIELEFRLLEEQVGQKATRAFGEYARRTVVNQQRTDLIVAPHVVNLWRNPSTAIIRLGLEVQDWLGQRLDIRYYPQRFKDGIFVGETLDDEHKQVVEETYRHFFPSFRVVDTPPGEGDLVVGWKHQADRYDIPMSEWTEKGIAEERLAQIDNFPSNQFYIPADQVQRLPQRLVDMMKEATARGLTEQPEGYGIPELADYIVRKIAEDRINHRPALTE